MYKSFEEVNLASVFLLKLFFVKRSLTQIFFNMLYLTKGYSTITAAKKLFCKSQKKQIRRMFFKEVYFSWTKPVIFDIQLN